MKKKIFTLISLVCLTGFISAEIPELWQKTRNIMQDNWRLTPGTTNVIIETRNARNDEIEDSRELVIRHELDEEGYIENFIVKAKVNGEDVSLESAYDTFKDMLAMDIKPSKKGIYFDDPHDGFSLTQTAETRIINGYNCVAFEFSYYIEEQDNEYSGIIWIDKESGAPIIREFSMKDTPRFVSSIDIEEIYHYEPESGEHYLLERNTYVNVSVLLKRMKNTTRMVYDNYWVYEDQ